METLRRIFHYLTHLEWTERRQHVCVFCDRKNFANIVYEDEKIIAINNRRLAGQIHWLILPKEHAVRDIENLNSSHLTLLQSMDEVKRSLIQERYPDIPPSSIHSGYHRGRRPMIGSIFYPDIISIHHLHLHVIVKPKRMLLWFKYPPWLRLMWKSDDRVLRELEMLSSKQI
ncbi:hypothetical protein ACHAO4_009516 [Trichoderma viride]